MDQRLPDPAGAAPPDWRGLCEELLRHAEIAQSIAVSDGLWDGDEDDGLFDRARAALVRWGHPPAPPAEGEVAELVEWLRDDLELYPAEKRRVADLLEQRQAAPVPVAVSERPWEREGWCHPEERWAWFYNRRVGWRDAIPPESLKPPTLFPYTHSLPFNALPLPQGEVK